MQHLAILISVPPYELLSPVDVLELMTEARHVGGHYWLVEDDTGSLAVSHTLEAEASMDAYFHLSDGEFRHQAGEAFNRDFSEHPLLRGAVKDLRARGL